MHGALEGPRLGKEHREVAEKPGHLGLNFWAQPSSLSERLWSRVQALEADGLGSNTSSIDYYLFDLGIISQPL